MTWEFWTAVCAMGVITWLTRALPFLLDPGSPLSRAMGRDGAALGVLGPCAIAAIATVIVLPPLDSLPVRTALPYLFGLAATGLTAWKTKNTGWSVIFGMAIFALALAVVPTLWS